MNFLLLGKPNVGKSSIYNILTGKKTNIIHNIEGTTRDWHNSNIINLSNCQVFDTPGILLKNNFIYEFHNSSIFRKLINKIDIFLYVIDYSSIFDEHDNDFINNLRKYNKKLILLINKFDNFKKKPNLDYFKYSVEKIFFLSSAHKKGFDILDDFLVKNYSKKVNINNNIDVHNTIAIFGKPNAGKSTFLNTILGFERSNTGKFPGTTTDYVESFYKYNEIKYNIIDTAGIQRKSNIKRNSLNFYSIKKSLEKVNEVDLAIVLIDSEKNIDRQDKRILNIVGNSSKSIIIIFNKFDLILNKKDFKINSIEKIKKIVEIKNIKLFFISAFSKTHINKILKYIYIEIISKKINISTSDLNKWLKKAITQKKHRLISSKNVNFKYAVIIKKHPITIKVYCNYANKITREYKRFLVNNFNKKFKIINQKTTIIFSSSNNPYI